MQLYGEFGSTMDEIRAASRDIVRELGFMDKHLAGTKLPASGVHGILEIGMAGRLSAKVLSERLLLEKSTVSRLVGQLIKLDLVAETRSNDDGRVKHLTLTRRGQAALAGIHGMADARVAGAIGPLSTRARHTIAAGLRGYADALTAARRGATSDAGGVSYGQGYIPGIIGGVVALHAHTYHHQSGFGDTFECKVASEMGAFVARLNAPGNALFHATAGGRIAGSVSIDGEDLAGELGDGVAHLRWFIVDPHRRGGGVGGTLLSRALAFADERGVRETHLWTLKGLEAARALYERHGFDLVQEYSGQQWGKRVTEQKFVRPLPGGAG